MDYTVDCEFGCEQWNFMMECVITMNSDSLRAAHVTVQVVGSRRWTPARAPSPQANWTAFSTFEPALFPPWSNLETYRSPSLLTFAACKKPIPHPCQKVMLFASCKRISQEENNTILI